MSAGGRGSWATRAGLLVLVGTAGASAVGIQVMPYLMGLAIPAFLVGAFSVMFGVEELSRPCFKLAVGLVVLALSGPALGGLMRVLLGNPWVQGTLCIGLAVLLALGGVWLAARAMTVKLPEKAKVHKAAVRERVALARPQPVLPAPQRQVVEDELRSLR